MLPPVVSALVSIAANVVLGPGGGGGLKGLLFNVALPLTSNFPTMAITTGSVPIIMVGKGASASWIPVARAA